jgi:MoaA/NifB/PqqE/SkfB family radical SAM enzyme
LIAQHLHVEIEPTNNCNTRCFHCPHETISRPKGLMEWDVYERVADQVMAYSDNFSVEYAGMGDPLINPRIYDFISYVSGSGFTSITTNASALTEKNMARAIEAGLGRLTISFNGTDPELYELMMGGLSFKKAEQHLATALRMAAGTGTQVGANVSVTRQTQDRLPEIKQYLEEAGVSNIFFSKCHHRGGFLKGDLVCNTPPPPVDDFRCDIFTKTLFVAWTGEVLSCCHDLAGDNVVGDLRTEQVADVFKRKLGIAAGGVKFDICKGCNDMYRFMEDRTPDGRPIADWVYELYTGPAEEPDKEVSSLSAWMQTIYKQENQGEWLFKKMTNRIETLDATIADQETRIRSLDQDLDAERAALHAVLDSRSWRTMQFFQRIRKALIPEGSRREAYFLKLFRS